MTGIRPGFWLSYDHTFSVDRAERRRTRRSAPPAPRQPSQAAPPTVRSGGPPSLRCWSWNQAYHHTRRPPDRPRGRLAPPSSLFRITSPPPPFTAGGRASRGSGTGRRGSVSAPARRAGRLHRTPSSPPRARVSRAEFEQRAHPLRHGKGLDGVRSPHGRRAGPLEHVVQRGRAEIGVRAPPAPARAGTGWRRRRPAAESSRRSRSSSTRSAPGAMPNSLGLLDGGGAPGVVQHAGGRAQTTPSRRAP